MMRQGGSRCIALSRRAWIPARTIPYAPPMSNDGIEWRWRYNRWIGVMYGPIPVGAIVVTVGFAIYYGFYR